jgi:hypothetical protein
MGEDSVARQNHGFIADYDDLAQDPGEAVGQIASLLGSFDWRQIGLERSMKPMGTASSSNYRKRSGGSSDDAGRFPRHRNAHDS